MDHVGVHLGDYRGTSLIRNPLLGCRLRGVDHVGVHLGDALLQLPHLLLLHVHLVGGVRFTEGHSLA